MATNAANTVLFEPLQIGHCSLSNRIVLAPLTRFRITPDHIPRLPLVKEYYAQRASHPGTLLISEATCISPQSVGAANVPGIWSDAQVSAWKEIVDAVHAKGSFIYMQLWAFGRAGDPQYVEQQQGALELISSSDIPIDANSPKPRALTEVEIWGYIKDYGDAARRAVEEAGFDGVELHGAAGYLIDQFTQDISNRRDDNWGGSVEKRARFALECTMSVINAVGKHRTGVKLSPWGNFQGMRASDPLQQFTYLIDELKKLEIAYLHLQEPRISGALENRKIDASDSNQPFVDMWDRSPILLGGGYTAETAVEDAKEYAHRDVAIVFGRWFIANPDLVTRMRNGWEWSQYDRSTFYGGDERGYIDYPIFKNKVECG